MKTTIITFISLVLMSGSCIAQEPDTHTYSERIIDSLNSVIDELKQDTASLSFKYDSLFSEQFSVFDLDTIDIWTTDIYIRLRDDRSITDLSKRGHNIMYQMRDTINKRRHISNYINYKSLQQLQ